MWARGLGLRVEGLGLRASGAGCWPGIMEYNRIWKLLEALGPRVGKQEKEENGNHYSSCLRVWKEEVLRNNGNHKVLGHGVYIYIHVYIYIYMIYTYLIHI